MTDVGPGGHPPYHTPSPFVTHKELGEVRESVGEIRATQQSIIATYNHLRGDMLNGFDKLAGMISAERQIAAKSAAQDRPEQGISLTGREALLSAVVLVMAGAIVAYILLKSGVPVERLQGLAG